MQLKCNGNFAWSRSEGRPDLNIIHQWKRENEGKFAWEDLKELELLNQEL